MRLGAIIFGLVLAGGAAMAQTVVTSTGLAPTVSEEDWRYLQTMLGQIAGQAAHFAVLADERGRQLEAVKTYWKTWCGDRPGCEPRPALSDAR